ncbi:hypothetical protein BT93_E1275 [Corymbia citriodora subsp. variegata]|nr:hypothetical protein BT93_E1275 [Corymbia citriodora subsp. variegata]KAF8028590.1 hypothetical protein BT93_E1275 [Corymbia citriodora subsp. variegata]KAF8028592.1 hypothetical protein BT93_E1275 [Corymbia citriodora subsp. variegata]
MGSGDWFKSIINLKKVKNSGSKQSKPGKQASSSPGKSNSFKWKTHSNKESRTLENGATAGKSSLGMPLEDRAALRIQTAFRAYMARKMLRRLKGIVRLQILTQNFSVKKQATTTLGYLHSWSKIQSQVRERRLCMVTEGRIKQKKLENQMKLEAKLHDLEVDWCGGSDTMDEILTRIHQREEASVKRERTMAYAFNHQWRANSNTNGLKNYELGKAGWGWSWMERWIAARPWESRVPIISPKKPLNKQGINVAKSLNQQTPKAVTSPKPPSSSNGKTTTKARRLSYPAAEKPASMLSESKSEEANNKKESTVA